MAQIYIYNYNNYYNRQVKKESNVAAYGDPVYYQSSINFNPNDGVNTTVTVGMVSSPYDGSGDYLLYTEDDATGVEIVSRWFIIDATRIRKGQYEVTLRRDVIADNYEKVLTAPVFIEKATVGDNDPAIYNSENMTFNQILSNLETLKDASGCPWLVGYAPSHTVLDVELDYTEDLVADYTADSISALPMYSLLNKTYTNYGQYGIDIYFNSTSDSSNYTVAYNSFDKNGDIPLPAAANILTVKSGYGWLSNTTSSSNATGYIDFVKGMHTKTPVQVPYSSALRSYPNRYYSNYIRQAINQSSWETIKTQVDIYTGNQGVSEIDQYANKICKVGNKYYRCVLQTTSEAGAWSAPIEGYKIPVVENIVRTAYNNSITNYINSQSGVSSSDFNPTTLPLSSSSSNYFCSIRTTSSGTAKLVLEEYTGQTSFKAKLTTGTDNLTLSDAPYDMFCMPYSDTLQIKTKGGTFTSRKEVALAVMNAINAKYRGSNTVIDIQFLPYCPLPQYLVNGMLDMTKASSLGDEFTNYYYVKDGTNVATLGVFIYCGQSTTQFTINKSIPITNKKVQSCCDMYRLCSPNYADIFEFNAAKNNGVTKFIVDLTYKPFTPYIHVCPDFGGLYGNNRWEDRETPRGLICGGDFSITALTDAFETYALQNKNYQLSFQRQIQNMEVSNSIQRQQEIASAISGSVSGAASGALVGSLGGPVGAVLGGVVGGVVSAAGGALDYSFNEKLRNEALDYTKDQFGYQLGNIKALPDTLAKLTTFTANNFIYPILEYYTCTDEEKQALQDKIKYNGMTVMRIGTINQFLQSEPSYIKGKLIRLESVKDDYHMIKSIAEELYKGVFI